MEPSAPACSAPPPPPPEGLWRAIRDVLYGGQHDYTSGSLGRAVLLLAVPMVLEMAMESLFAIVDVYFVSRLPDQAVAVATVGLTEAMLTILYALAIGVSMAATALVARRIGEGNPAGAARAARQAVLVGILFGVATGIPCAIFAPDLLRLMDASPEVVEQGSGYTSVLLGTNVVIFLLFLQNAVFRGAGDAALAMRSLWLANGINIVLDPCLIFGWGPFPEMGLTGAAVATTIGRGTGVLYQYLSLRSGKSRIALPRPLLRLEMPILRELLRLSAGGVAQFIIATASWVALMKIVAPFGNAAVAGYTIAIRILIFTILPAWGLSNAAATLVGQNLGAGRPDRAERSVWITGWANAGFLGLVMAVFLTLGPWLIGFFSDEAETVRHGADALRIMSYGYFFYAWGMVMAQAFNGAGDTMTPTRLNFVFFWCIQIPLAWILARKVEMGPPGVYWSVAITESLLASAAVAIFRLGRWKTVKLAQDVAEAPEPPSPAPLSVALEGEEDQARLAP